MSERHADAYLLHADDEPRRLEMQAELSGIPPQIARIEVRPGERVLDAGCGSGFARPSPRLSRARV